MKPCVLEPEQSPWLFARVLHTGKGKLSRSWNSASPAVHSIQPAPKWSDCVARTERNPSSGNHAESCFPSIQTSSWETNRAQDEIDFEWLLKDRTKVQTNYYVGGVGGHEVMIDLGFDCAADFHNYALMWTSKQTV